MNAGPSSLGTLKLLRRFGFGRLAKHTSASSYPAVQQTSALKSIAAYAIFYAGYRRIYQLETHNSKQIYPQCLRYFHETRVYAETSVISYFTTWASRDLIIAGYQEVTRQWWQAAPAQCDLVISEFAF